MDMCRLVQGPVTGLATLDGSLVVAYGSRIDLYAWTGLKLQRVAFHDAPVEVTCLATIKSFLVYGDALKGLYFLQAAQGTRQLTQISKARDRCHAVLIRPWSCLTVVIAGVCL